MWPSGSRCGVAGIIRRLVQGVDCGWEAELDTSVASIEIRDGDLVVEWADGNVCEFEARYLRLNCGCAQCVEEWSRRQLLDPATVDADLRAEDFLLVGQYAVQILWSDAHFTGIYPFDLLRKLCKCDECESSRTAAGD